MAANPSKLFDSVALLLSSDHLAVLTATTERITHANNALLRMIRCTREEIDAGIDWRGMTPTEYWALDERGLQELRTFGACVPFEKEYALRDGTRLPILIGAVRICSEPLEWACFVVDLSAQKHAAEAERATRELETKRYLANELAHQLNNPLAILTNALFLLMNDNITADQRKLLSDATAAVERISETVRLLLAATVQRPRQQESQRCADSQ